MMPIEFKTATHTKAFNEYSPMLLGVEFRYENGDIEKIAVHACKEYEDIYYMTKYMRDEELDFINQQRIEKWKHSKTPYQPLPRLAYIGDGKFQAVRNQYERMELEKRIFANDNHNHSVSQAENTASNGMKKIGGR